MKYINALIIVLTLSGCTAFEVPKVVSEQRETFLIVNFDPPKHVYVDIKRITDGVVFKRIYVSKHWGSPNPTGKEISLVRQKLQRGESTWDSFVGVREAIQNAK